MTSVDMHWVNAATAAIEKHNETANLPVGADPEVDVWQLIHSLRAYCDFHGVDFDSVASEERDA